MIQALQCEGYKAFSRFLQIDLCPITVFFGKNNSGKTTLARLPLLIAASLTNADSLYALSSHNLSFGSSFIDLASATNPHPALSLGIQWSPQRRVQVELQHITSQEEADTVQPTFIDVDGFQRRIALRATRTRTSRELIDSVLTPAAQGRLVKHTGALQDLLDRIVHVPSSRPRIASIYTVRPPTAWSVEEVPYLLRSKRRLLKAVDDWFQKNLDRSGIDIDQAAFAFRLVETREGSVINFAHSGRGPQSAIFVVTLLLAIASGVRPTPLMIVEEPEAHLHPSVHGDIADLFVRCASKSQLVVETHSENFLLRLRRRIAEGRLSAENIALYFIDNSHNVRRVPLDRFGSTNRWPSGIFESDIEEARAIIEAKMSVIASEGDGS